MGPEDCAPWGDARLPAAAPVLEELILAGLLLQGSRNGAG